MIEGCCCCQDYTEDYIQTGPGQLYAQSTRMFSIDKESVPYSWNHTITYDPARGKMPFLVEMLHATAISTVYHPLEEVLEYRIQASISKGERVSWTRRKLKEGMAKERKKEDYLNIAGAVLFYSSFCFFATFLTQ